MSGRKIHFRQENSFSLPPWPLCRARPAWPTAPQPSSRTSGWRDAAASEPLSVCLSCPSACPSVRPFPGSHPAPPTGVPPGCLRRPSEGLGARPAGIPPPPPGTARTGGGIPYTRGSAGRGPPRSGLPRGRVPAMGAQPGRGIPGGSGQRRQRSRLRSSPTQHGGSRSPRRCPTFLGLPPRCRCRGCRGCRCRSAVGRAAPAARSPRLCLWPRLHHPPYIAERAALVFTLAASPGLMSCY